MRAIDWIARLGAAGVLLHLVKLGIEIQGDGGLLFALAWIVLPCGAVTACLHRASLRWA